MKCKRIPFKERILSFRYAFHGLGDLIRQEHHARLHCVGAALVIVAGFLLKLNAMEWVAVVFAIGFVFAAETVNTALERLADVVQPERDDRIRDVKDLAAAAVLVCALTAAAIGLIVFLPKLIALF